MTRYHAVASVALAAAVLAGGLACSPAAPGSAAAPPPAPAPTPADEPVKIDPAAAEQAGRRAEVVSGLARATELTAFGRGELAADTGLTGFKSPEALVAAAGILLRANAATGGKLEKLDLAPTDEDGKPVKAEPAPAVPGLKEEADALFDEARAMVGTDKAKAAELEKLIKEAGTFEQRGAVGFPRRIAGALPVGAYHYYTIPFVPGYPASVAMRSTNTTRLKFEVFGNNNARLFHYTGGWAYYNWVPNRGGVKAITLRVTNLGPNAAAYQLLTN